jgi:hypothetical protein
MPGKKKNTAPTTPTRSVLKNLDSSGYGGGISHLRKRWQDLFAAKFEVLLYDLTSTYFECDPPDSDEDKRRFGYNRDKRNDCVQVVIALVVTPDGFPLGYEVLAGNTRDSATLRPFLRKIEEQYGKAERIWVRDRGIPTEEVLVEMGRADPPIYYLVGTPKGRLTKFENALFKLPWQAVREGVDVKLLPKDAELYVLAKSDARILKERGIRRRKLRWLLARLKEISKMELLRDDLLMKLGAARAKAPAAWRLLDVEVAPEDATFSYALNRKKLRKVWRREGRYLLRTNLSGRNPAELWQFYTQLVEVEAAFKNLKDDLQLRPIYHQLIDRIEAHIFVAFLDYCLHVTLRARLRPLASGLTPRAVLDKFAAIQMLDVHFPTTDGRTLNSSKKAWNIKGPQKSPLQGGCGGLDDLASCGDPRSRLDGQVEVEKVGLVRFDELDAAAVERLTLRVPRIVESVGLVYRYNKCVFLAPPWPEIYTLDQERRHGLAAAIAEYNRLIEVYPSLGYDIHVLPRVNVAERANWILASLER